jgi:hypothetical protein
MAGLCSGENAFPVRYELGFYIPEYVNLHSHRRETLKSYIVPPVVSGSVEYMLHSVTDISGC